MKPPPRPWRKVASGFYSRPGATVLRTGYARWELRRDRRYPQTASSLRDALELYEKGKTPDHLSKLLREARNSS